jgi:hypothetical protein
MADIILTKADGTTDVTYKQQSNQGTVKVYANESAGLVEPETLRVQHYLRPVGAKGTDRHQVVLQKLIVDDTTNQNLVMSVSLQYSIPRSSEITLAMLKDMQAQLTSYVNRSATLTSLFNGATPESDYNVTGPFNPTLA